MNRSMAAKYAKAKKCAMQEALERENMKSCATRVIPHTSSMSWHKNHVPNYA